MRKLNEILSKSSDSATSEDAGTTSPASAEPEAEPRCPHCDDTGFVRRAVGLGHPDFGKALPCDCVGAESQAQRAARLTRYSNLGDLARHRFETIIRRGSSAVAEHQARYASAVEQAEAYAEAPQGWLVLSGPSGCGKTHLAAAIANRIIERGDPVLFMIVPDLLDHLRAAYAPGASLSYDQLFEQVRSAPVLILDGLGVQSPTPWADEKLFQLINHRYNTGAATVVTTTHAPEQLEERLRTRLCDERMSRMVVLEGRSASPGWSDDGLNQPLLRAMTFDSFERRDLSLPKEVQDLRENAHRQALAFAQDPEGWLIFYGGHGGGKTHLAAAIANHRRAAGNPVLFQVVPDLLDHLRSSFRPDSPVAYDELFDRVRTVPLLILDDFGAYAGSPWAQEKLYQIVNYRYNAQLPTVFTMSESIDSMDERFSARLEDHRIATRLWLIAPHRPGRAAAEAQPPKAKRGRPPARR